MRVIDEELDMLFDARPFANGVGASLYVGVVDPLSDPGPTSIIHRRNRLLDGAGDVLAHVRGEYDLGADSVPKSPRVAFTESPSAEITLTVPADWYSKAVWVQVRPFADNYENETIYRPQRLLIDSEGNPETPVLGTATILAKEKRDAGGLRLRFAYKPSRDGATPTGFILRKATGTGTITDGTVSYDGSTPGGSVAQRVYEIDITGLTNAVAYTFDLLATDGSIETTLIAAIAFTGDAAGPPAVTNARATEV